MFDWLAGLWNAALAWLSGAFDGLADKLLAGLEGLTAWLASTLSGLWDALTQWLTPFLQPIMWFFQDLLYLASQLLQLVVLVLKIVLLLIQVIFSLGQGVITTITSIATFEPAQVTTLTKSVYGTGIDLVFAAADQVGFSVIVKIFAWGVWIAAAFAVGRILRTD